MVVFNQITMDRLTVGVVARRSGIALLTPGARKRRAIKHLTQHHVKECKRVISALHKS
jgi:6-phosphogluconolactonase/glucosamine-6-phosphate isomerase/deaminase